MLAAKYVFVAVTGLYLIVGAYLYLNQRKLLYLPSTERIAPAAIGLSFVEEVALAPKDGERIIAWHVRPEGDRPVILFFQGNGGSIGQRPERLATYVENGFGVLFLSYRGYGGSSGSPSEQGLLLDAVTAYDWLIAKGYAAARIVLVGESLGSGIAVALASMRKVAAVALEAPYSSMGDVAAFHYWYLPVRLLLKDRYDSFARIGRIDAPLLITHGDRDTMVPLQFGRKLFAAASEPKEFFTLDSAGHEAIFDSRVWKREMSFFQTHVLKQ
jgi:fermentation-respiration switch protein FrsA (DUF1100 family)